MDLNHLHLQGLLVHNHKLALTDACLISSSTVFTAPQKNVISGELSPLLQEALSVIDRGLTKTKTDQRFFTLFAVICLSLAYVVSVIHIPYPIDFFVSFFVLVLILATGFGIIQNFIMIRSEVHGLMETKEDIKLVLQNLYHRSKN